MPRNRVLPGKDLLSGLACSCQWHDIEKMGPIYNQMEFGSLIEDIHDRFFQEFSLRRENMNFVQIYYNSNFKTDEFGFTIF